MQLQLTSVSGSRPRLVLAQLLGSLPRPPNASSANASEHPAVNFNEKMFLGAAQRI